MRRFVGLMAVLFLAVSGAWAQFDMMGMMRGKMYGPVTLLTRKEVQKELNLNGAQNDSLKKIQKEQMEADKAMGADARAGDPSKMMAMMEKMQAQDRELAGRAMAVLDEPQRKRLSEIRAQLLGIQAAFDPEVQAALMATDAQKESLKGLSSEYAMASMQGLAGARSQGDVDRRRAAVETEYRAKVGAILTPEQMTKLKEREGAPFKDLKKIGGF